jgi:hypothetical protein
MERRFGKFCDFDVVIYKEDEENLNPHIHLINKDKDIPINLCTPNGYFHTGDNYNFDLYKDPFDNDLDLAREFDRFMEGDTWINILIDFCYINNLPVRLFTKPAYEITKGFYSPPYPHIGPDISSEPIKFSKFEGQIEVYAFENMRIYLHFHIFEDSDGFSGKNLIYPVCLFSNRYYIHNAPYYNNAHNISTRRLSDEDCEILDTWMRKEIGENETNWTRTIDHLYMLNPQYNYIDVKPDMQPDYTKLNENRCIII